MLRAILRDLSRGWRNAPRRRDAARRVLNVGGGSKAISLPPYFAGWDHLLLDIDPRGKPDIVADARNLGSLDAGQFDAVYCSHNLEHYYRHDGDKVLRGFLHVLKADGFAEVRVPDIAVVIRRAVEAGVDLDAVLYVSPAGPIAVHDVIYGLGREIEASGNDYYAHKTGFSPRLLSLAFDRAGFARNFIFRYPENFEIRALAFKAEPTDFHRDLLDLSAASA